MIGLKPLIFIAFLFAFAKAYAIPQQSELSSSTEAEVIYKKLDSFLAAVSSESLIAFDEYLSKTDVNTNDGKLAKVIALSNLGFYEQSFGQLHTAIQHYSEAWNIYNANKLQGFDILESCLKPLGNLYTQTNALDEAQNTIEQYILLAQESKNKKVVAGGIANLSVVYNSQSKYARAIQILKNGLSLYPENADLWMNLATSLYGNGNSKEAFNAVNKSLELKPEQPNGYKLLSQIYFNNGRFQEAIKATNKNITLLKTDRKASPRNLAKSFLLLAEIQLVQATDGVVNLDLSPAHAAIEQSFAMLIPDWKRSQQIPEVTQLYGENTLMDALDLKAEVYFTSNEIEKGLHALELASQVNDLLDEEITAQQSKLTLRSSVKKRTERYLINLFEVYKETQSDSLFEKALRVIEKAKNTVVYDAYSESKKLQREENDTLAIKLRQLKTRQASLNSQLILERSNFSENSTGYVELLETYHDLTYKLKMTREKWALKYLHLQSNTKINLNSLQEKTARKEEVFLSYFIGQSQSYSVSVDGNTFRFNQIIGTQNEQNTFKEAIKKYVSFFNDASRINANPQEYAAVAHELYNLLKIPQNKRIIISPDSVLNFVPFAALTTLPSETMNYKKMPFLLFESEVSYTLSGKSYLETDQPMPKNPSALGVFPVFEGTGLELKYSLQEADGLSSQFDTELLLREEAVGETAFAKANNHNILHFSTHATGGTFSTQASIKFYDDEISVTNFYGETFLPELVVLSACETGIGTLAAGEGAQSLARGFQYAGARNILFSLWRVNDKTTAQLMTYYYKNLVQINSRNLSLHNAQINFLNNDKIPNAQKSPYYWAPFIYYGTTEKAIQSNKWMWVVAVIFIVFLAFLIFKNGFTTRVSSR